MRRLLAALMGLLLVSCGPTPTPEILRETVEVTKLVQQRVVETKVATREVTVLVTQPPLPTHTPLPTYTPYPTYTPLPTDTPTPTPTSTPTETPTPTPTPTPTETPTSTPTLVPYKVAFGNMFSWPGWWWPGHPGAEISKDGSTIRISHYGTGTGWTHFGSENRSSWLTVRGDFEIRFGISFGKDTNKQSASAGLMIDNKGYLGQKERDYIDMFFLPDYFGKPHLRLAVGRPWQRDEPTTLWRGSIPFPVHFRVRFENVGRGVGETLSLLNDDTGEIISRGQLPFQFFHEKTKLSFDLKVRSGVEFVTFSDFQILVPEGSQNVVR